MEQDNLLSLMHDNMPVGARIIIVASVCAICLILIIIGALLYKRRVIKWQQGNMLIYQKKCVNSM